MIIKEDALMGYETPEEKEKRLRKNKKKNKMKKKERQVNYAKQSSEIMEDPDKIYKYTNKGKRVAVISDGSAVLDLGVVDPKAALPVVESKARLLERHGKVEAVPICLDATGVEELVTMIKGLAPAYGAIFLEDIAAPKCIELQQKLQNRLKIPIYHDDQQGTAIVVLAALYNALKVVDKNLEELKVVINGAGTAGLAITKLLLAVDIGEIILCDKEGILTLESKELNFAQREILENSKVNLKAGSLETALIDADVFIGVSVGDVLEQHSIKKMKKNPIIFALATPVPEIEPELAKESGAKIVATAFGKDSNQINNQLVFAGLIRGLLAARASELSLSIQIITAKVLANLVKKVTVKNILPSPADVEVADKIAEAVVKEVKKLDEGPRNKLEKEEDLEDLPLEVMEHLLD